MARHDDRRRLQHMFDHAVEVVIPLSLCTRHRFRFSLSHQMEYPREQFDGTLICCCQKVEST